MDQYNEDQASEEPQTEAVASTRSPLGKWILAALAFFVVIGGTIAGAFLLLSTENTQEADVETDIVRIGLSLDSVKIQRWAEERDFMISKAQELGATVAVFSAENDDPTQIAQIENLISQGVDAIIVVAHDAALLGPVLEEAREAGIKVINYDRLTANGTPDLYLSFDSVKVGEAVAQHVIDHVESEVPNIAYVGGSPTDNNTYLVLEGAMSVLQPLADQGKIHLVYNEFTKDWSPSEAYTNFKRFLDEGGEVDGVVTAYDGLAFGVIQALAEHGQAGSVPVSGQNGELQAVQRIVQGTQTMTAWKPGKPLAEKAIEAAVAFAKGETPEINGSINNGTANIPSYLFDPITVTKENLEATVIQSGTYGRDQVYTGNQ